MEDRIFCEYAGNYAKRKSPAVVEFYPTSNHSARSATIEIPQDLRGHHINGRIVYEHTLSDILRDQRVKELVLKKFHVPTPRELGLKHTYAR